MTAPVLEDVAPVRAPARPPRTGPPTGRLVLEAVAVGVVAMVAAFFVWGFRGPGLDAPLNYEEDAAFYLMQARLLEQGDWFTTPSLGWEGGFQLYDLPQGADAFNLVSLRAISLVAHDPATILNTFFLLTYGFVAGVGYAVLRLLRIGAPLAVVGALLYSFAPYHQVRNTGHLMLSNYAMVPVAVLLALAVLGTDPPVVGDGRGLRGRIAWRSARTWWVVAACIGLASTGSYYAVFAVLLLLAAGALGSLGQWRWRPLAAAAAMVVVLGATFFVHQVPSLLYWQRHGTNPEVAHRQVWENELYGLRINQLFLPVDNHRLAPLARLARLDNDTPLKATEPGQQLGAVAAAGLAASLLVAVAAVLAGRRRARWVDSELATGVARLGMLAFGCMLVAAIGGVSYLLAGLGLKDIRSWNRISIVIGFLGLLAVLWAAQWLADRWHERRTSTPGWALGLVVAVPLGIAGFLDAVPAHHAPPPVYSERQNAHRDFFEQVALRVPARSPILQVPYLAFPEPDDQNPMGSYDQARGYIYAPGLRWTYGWVKGRGESPSEALAAMDPGELPAVAAESGFAGIVVDRVGITTDPDGYVAALVESAGTTPLQSADGRYVFVPLTAPAPAG